ncbi:MAG: DegV family protein [Atopostipes sp.]|nr:DegV family protein [Atopostipes sp.]
MNNKICQIVDSSGNIPEDLVEEYQIIEVPFYFKFEDSDDYKKENIDYRTSEFFKKMEENPDNLPQTAAPNMKDWLSAFEEQYAKEVRNYIVTTISSKLSASLQTVTLAKQLYEDEHADVRIEIIDSDTVASGQAALEIWIAKMIAKGKDYDYIVENAREMVPNLNTIFVTDSLKYMNAGGRIGDAAAFLGKAMSVKPISEFIEGEVEVVKPMIGRKRSLRTIVDIAISRINNIENAIIVVQDANAEKDAKYMYDYIDKKTDDKMIFYKNNLGITVGTHSGPGTIGIGFLEIPS